MVEIIRMHQSVSVSFNDAYEKYYKQISHFFCKKIGNIDDAEDLTEEVFSYCYKNWNNYDPQKATLSTWIYLIANSRYKNYCRDRKIYIDIDERLDISDESDVDMEQAVYVEELRKVLNTALLQLSEQQRQIVVLRYFGGAEIREIAVKLQITPNNVRVQMSKALKRMKSILERAGVSIDG